MKRNLVTILLLIIFVFLLLGGGYLYQTLLNREAVPMEAIEAPSEPILDQKEPGSDPAKPEVIAETSETEQSTSEFAPDFTMLDREGEEHLLSNLFGKPIILNFWATWCGPCQRELPYFDAANETYKDQIQFVMLDLTDGMYETRESGISFAEKNAYHFPLYFDEKGEAAAAYGISAIPLTVLIDENGQVVETHLGTMSSAELQQLIDKVLNK